MSKKDVQSTPLTPRMTTRELNEPFFIQGHIITDVPIHVLDWHPKTKKPWHAKVDLDGEIFRLVDLMADKPVMFWMKENYKDPVRQKQEDERPLDEMVQCKWVEDSAHGGKR